ncbi:hypothetical protein [Pedobacter sp. N23S346]|uniref:hypothetical protein n=1 Tax=Pedobacter sp. N23S346 TaxID=3402750 RepID=UPI003AD64A6F
MRYLYAIILIFFFLTNSYAQEENLHGEKFEFETSNEKDPSFVLLDNYNHYLLTNINVDGVMAGHQIIIRKFDQKNNLVGNFKADFPTMDANSLYEYLGFAESQNGKLATFVEVHSGRANKSEIYKIEFDKVTSKFTTILLATNPIISLMKSGSISLEKSENGRFIAINFQKYRNKGLAEKNQIIVINSSTLEVVWQKELSFEDEYTSQNFTVTNSGKVILVRDMKGSKKGITYLVSISDSSQENKTFESPVFLNEMKSISIGPEEYLVAFNSASKNFIEDFYNSLMLYDLKSGKILNNTKITSFASVKGLRKVTIRNVVLQNNEINILAEAKANVMMGSTTGYGAAPISTSLDKMIVGPSFMFKINFEGELKEARDLRVNSIAETEIFPSFGFINAKGAYYIAKGKSGDIYSLNNLNEIDKDIYKARTKGVDPYGNGSGKYLNQLITYFPDKNTILQGRIVNNNEMSLLSFKIK